MSEHYSPGRMGIFEYQPPAMLNQPGPVQNTYYIILAPTGFVRVYDIGVNIEDTNESLQVTAIVDGETIEGQGFAATHSTAYYGYLQSEPIARTDRIYLDVIGAQRHRAFILEGRNVMIQVRKTTANGAGNLTGIVLYGVLSGTS